MENKDIPFYLGKPLKTETGKKEEAPATHLSYGGAIPYAYEHHQPRQRTNEDLARARLLSEKHQRKSMVVWRLLYLEKRRQRILDSLASATRNVANAAIKREILCLAIAVIAAICLLLVFPLKRALLCISAAVLLYIIYLFFRRSTIREYRGGRIAEWNRELQKMQDEHEELEQEKEQLTAEIKELESLMAIDEQ